MIRNARAGRKLMVPAILLTLLLAAGVYGAACAFLSQRG